MASLLNKLETAGTWTHELDLVLVVLLAKPYGGYRPIGLFPTLIRLWMKARVSLARDWEHANADASLYGAAGMGAQRAAWLEAFNTETAALNDLEHAQVLLDLTKAFETVSHQALIDAATKRGYPLDLLRMALQAYRMERAVGINGTHAQAARGSRGITAGSGLATFQLRLLLMCLTRRDTVHKTSREPTPTPPPRTA